MHREHDSALSLLYSSGMDTIELETRRAARKLVAVSIAMVILLGIPIGLTVAWHTIDRVTVITTCEGTQI